MCCQWLVVEYRCDVVRNLPGRGGVEVLEDHDTKPVSGIALDHARDSINAAAMVVKQLAKSVHQDDAVAIVLATIRGGLGKCRTFAAETLR